VKTYPFRALTRGLVINGDVNSTRICFRYRARSERINYLVPFAAERVLATSTRNVPRCFGVVLPKGAFRKQWYGGHATNQDDGEILCHAVAPVVSDAQTETRELILTPTVLLWQLSK
jgi:hypothetical protein